MNIEQVREYTLSLSGVTEDQAFGEDILNFRFKNCHEAVSRKKYRTKGTILRSDTCLPLEQKALE